MIVLSNCMQAHDQATGCLAVAQRALSIEAEAIARASDRLDGNLSRAVNMILDHPGKIIVTGIGKSGHIARKIVATLCSTGTPAVFLHPAEASHGDLGIYSAGDPTLIVSSSGATRNCCALVPLLRDLRSQRIGILGNGSLAVGRQMDVLLDASVEREADPTTSLPRPARTWRSRSGTRSPSL